MASERQTRYALLLLAKKGYSVGWMNASHKELGALMNERTGRVEDWVRKKNIAEASQLIKRLLQKPDAE